MKWTVVLLALVASTGDMVRIAVNITAAGKTDEQAREVLSNNRSSVTSGLVALFQSYFAGMESSSLHANLLADLATDPDLMELDSAQASGADVPLITTRHIDAMEKVVDKNTVNKHWSQFFSVLPDHMTDWKGMEPMWKDLEEKGSLSSMLTLAYLANKFTG